MADLEQTLREIFGDSVDKLTQYQRDKMQKLQSKIRDIAHEALRDDLTRLSNEIIDLKTRVTELESERVRKAAEDVEPY
ncbi:MAG: hypothetical protein WBX15_02635 [Thermoanaerobaculia bacterium]